jgi:hypothetical protein
MSYKDLSNYDYWYSDDSGNLKNIGWLENNKSFTQGNVSFEFIGKLKKLFFGSDSYSTDTNGMRGPAHCCNLCDKNGITISFNGKTETLGLCEIWVPGKNSELIYISPSMIIHYIEVHNYRPPEAFIDAVMSTDLSTFFNASDLNHKILLKVMQAKQ